MCPTPASRVTLLTCICRNSAAALALTGLSEDCGAFLCISAAVVISVPMWGQREQTIALNREHGLFLSTCPITFRRSVIPPRNNRQHEPDSWPQILIELAELRVRLIETPGLTEMTISDQSTRKILDAAMVLAIRGAAQSVAAGHPDGVGVVEGLAKPGWLCPLLRDT
jgi:hypothetical protein